MVAATFRRGSYADLCLARLLLGDGGYGADHVHHSHHAVVATEIVKPATDDATATNSGVRADSAVADAAT